MTLEEMDKIIEIAEEAGVKITTVSELGAFYNALMSGSLEPRKQESSKGA